MWFERDTWQEIWASIRKHKLRTFLTALGVFWGIFMLVFILGMGAGLQNGVFINFEGQAKNLMYLWTTPTSKPYKGFQPGREPDYRLEDMQAVRDEFPEIQYVAPRLSMQAPVTFNGESGSWQIRGELTDMIEIEALTLHTGRYLNPIDIAQSRKTAVIGTRVQEELFGTSDPIGQYIRIKGIPFQVIGTFGPYKVKPWTEDDMEAIVIPLPTMHAAFGTGNRIDYFVVSAYENVRSSALEPRLKDFLRKRHQVAPNDPRGIGGFNLEDEYRQFQNLFLGINSFLWFVGIGTLLAGIVGVSNIMLIVVKERTREIGVRKAMGATPGSIIGLILSESVFITGIAGYLGLMGGTLLIWGIDSLIKMNDLEPENFNHPEVNLVVGIVALVIVVLSGLVAGFVPARHAARISPVEALKDQ